MKLTRASSYAIQALVHMATQKSETPVASHHVAQAKGIPERFLLKVLKPLVSTRVLSSIKGPNGGYKISRDPSKVTLLEIIEAVDGPIRGQAPFEEGGALNVKLEHICKQAAEATRKHLEHVSLADLCKKGR
ncbi:MAG: RrF2 family transcriptional regulator [Gemmataceae bacterium]|jgi:Rrf2 family protein